MMKKSILVKVFTCAFSTAIVAGGLAYSSAKFKPQKIDVSGFANAASNFHYIAADKKADKNRLDVLTIDSNANEFKLVESKINGKIQHTRHLLKAIPKMKIDNQLLLKKLITKNFFGGEFEINNRELIKLYAFEFEQRNKARVNKKAEEKELEIETKTDFVELAQSSIDKEVMKVDEADASKNSEEMVMYDYSEKKDEMPATKKIFDGKISDTVKDVIKRESHKNTKVAMDEMNIQSKSKKRLIEKNTEIMDEIAEEDSENVVYDYSSMHASALSKDTNKKDKSAQEGFAPEETNKEFKISANEISLNTQKVAPAFGFEFVPDYDREERVDDKSSGEIKLGYSLTGEMNTQTGVVQMRGIIPTRVELNLLDGEMSIPLLNEESIQKFLEKSSLDIIGNLLMVAVDSDIVDVEIDSKYQEKLFFNEGFGLEKSKENAAFVLFLGVKSGNLLLKYFLSNKETAQKIIYVGDGEMYFEDSKFENSQRDIYSLSTRSLLGKKVRELNIDASKISFFGATGVAKKKALNVYELKAPALVENTRKYLEFKHLDFGLFVGTGKELEIEIPGQDFIEKVLMATEVSTIGERCVVQLNLKKDLLGFKASGKNKLGEMFVEKSFLDKDGSFSREDSELSEKVFLTGDMEGMFNARLDYTDGTTEFLKTFCTESSYLVEQL